MTIPPAPKALATQSSPCPKLFIVGCPRSGTTWLWQMLKLHPEALSPHYESHIYRLIYNPFTFVSKLKRKQRFDQATWFLKHYGLKSLLLGASSQDVWRGILKSYRNYARAGTVGPHNLIDFKSLKTLIQQVQQEAGSDLERAERLIGHICEQYFAQEGQAGQKLLIEKTPLHIDFVDVILNQFPEAKVIIVSRDGRDVCASWQARAKTQKWARQSTEHIIQTWNRCAEQSLDYMTNPNLSDRIRLVKYEDLRQNTSEELEQVFDFLALSTSPAQITSIVERQDIQKMKKKGEGQHVRKGLIGDWRQTLPSEDIKLWETLAARHLEQLDYVV